MKNLFLLIVLLICSMQVFAQIIPNYTERQHPFITDTIFTGSMYQVGATEGLINADEYKLAPGDKLFISISGIEELPLNTVINQEGYIYIPKVGGIDLSNLTLSAGRQKIIDDIDRYYKNVDVFVSLYDFRRIKVSLIGDVKNPSNYIVPGNSRLVDLIMVSQGFNNTSDLRNIRIIDNSGITENYDLLKFLRLGDKSNNPLLTEGDVVLVDKVDRTVAITGEIMYPGNYEYVEGESAESLINLAGGLLSKAKKDTIEIVSFLDDNKTQVSNYMSFEKIISGKIILSDKDQIIIRSIPEILEEKYVLLKGYIKYPGYYKISENQTRLTDILTEAGGFRKEASLNEATLYRETGADIPDPEFERIKLIPRSDMSDDEYDYLKAKSRQRKGNVVIDFYKLFRLNQVEEDLFLKPGDVINVPEQKNYIIMIGQIINPGNIIYKEGLNYEDYIILAGGFGWRALENDVRIVKANTGEWIDADEDIILEPGDTIWVPEDPPGAKFWDVFLDTLTVLGQLAAVVAAVAAVIAVSR